MEHENLAKAVAKSISFRPFSLYQDATAYGLSLPDKLNTSEVVCRAVRQFLDAEGFVGASNDHTKLIAKVATALRERPALSDEIQALLKRARRAS